MDVPRDGQYRVKLVRRRKQMLYINTYMWSLKKNWHRQSYLQSRNKGTDVENKCMDTKGEGGEWVELGNWG